MNNDTVVYLQCPHCKKGWYGKFLYKETHQENEEFKLDAYVIQGLAPTDLTKELTCLNCGTKYTPIEDYMAFKRTPDGIDFKSPIAPVPKDCELHEMTDWVAYLLTTCRGH